MGHYQQLTREQMYGIYTLLKTGHNRSEIAAGIGVHKSTISRELRRNPAAPPQGGTGPAGSGDGGGTENTNGLIRQSASWRIPKEQRLHNHHRQ